MRDALYVPLDQWDDFLCEPADRSTEPDLIEQLVDIKPGITRIAVPQALIERRNVRKMHGIFQYFFHLEALFVVVDAQPDLQSMDNDMKVQRRWELERTQGDALIWEGSRGGSRNRRGHRGEFDWSIYFGDANICGLLVNPTEVLNYGLQDCFLVLSYFCPVKDSALVDLLVSLPSLDLVIVVII